jgi:tryptophan synthase alpha chain
VTADLEARFVRRIQEGGSVFVPYVTGGLAGVDPDLLRGLQAAGADAVEVGLPFSDPVMDGPVIEEASRRALEGGMTPTAVLDLIKGAGVKVPVVVMTYANPVFAFGLTAFAQRAADAGVSGVIVPDLPVDEAAEWLRVCDGAGVAPVLLAAPGTSVDRLRMIGARSRGFVYCVSTYGVTGERVSLSESSEPLIRALRPLTSLPLVLGVGIGSPEQAREACRFADGVVVGSALVRPLLDGDRDRCLELVQQFRRATLNVTGER